MKVDLNYSKENNMDCFVGDIIQHGGKPYMVVSLEENLEKVYGLLVLEGFEAGQIHKFYNSLGEIDSDVKSERMLIKKAEVLIIIDEKVGENS